MFGEKGVQGKWCSGKKLFGGNGIWAKMCLGKMVFREKMVFRKKVFRVKGVQGRRCSLKMMFMQGLSAGCIYVGSGDPVRGIRLSHNKYAGYVTVVIFAIRAEACMNEFLAVL